MNYVYYRDNSDNQVYAYDTETQQSLIDEAINKGWEDLTGSYPPPPPPPTAEDNKIIAVSLLSQTDWVNQPDVRDVNNNPHLLNGDEFDAYRLELRKIAVNPVSGHIVFPVIPQEQWSS